MTLNFQRSRNLLHKFKFSQLFIEELGWSQPSARKAVAMEIEGETYHRTVISELSGVVVFEIATENGQIPSAKTRAAIQKQIAELALENLLIFLDQNRTQSLWYWVKRDGAKRYPREHLFVKGQPGDLFLGKISALVVDLIELEDNSPSVVEVAQRLQRGLDVERVTKRFYEEFKQQHIEFLSFIQGIDKEADRRWYASVILNRLMFVYFLQRKGFVDQGNLDYLKHKLDQSQQQGADRFFSEFLQALFFEGFAKPESQRSPEARSLIGEIKYLNGGLFLKHKIEQAYPHIAIPNRAFENIFNLFARYSWNLDDTPGGNDDEINPDVLGYIFEKYINQKAFGAYYTRPEITGYLCDRTINKLILDRINEPGIPGIAPPRQFESINDLLIKLDADLCRRLLLDVLPKLSLLDPACGSGAFLVAAMKTLIDIYAAVIGKIEFLGDRNLKAWLKEARAAHSSLSYFIKKRIITNNLYGVDIMEEATEIAQLRLFLALVSSAHDVNDLEPLPNIDFNIMAGNSLIGLMQVDDVDYDGRHIQGDLFRKTYRQVLEEKNRLIDSYRNASTFHEDLQSLRDNIDEKKAEAVANLNEILLDEFKSLGIKYEQAQLTGKSKKRPLTISDITALEPFHWGYEFDEILQRRGGFDAIITNPPWEAFKPQAKEFFVQHNELVTKNRMDIKAFEKAQEEILEDPEIAAAWLEYQGQFPHISAYYRSVEQYKNQISIVNGKKAGTDINLYKLFLEQCFNLLRPGGECGIVIPSGIYTDLGTKQLREMLFSQTEVTGLFCFENRKGIFEGVHRSFKFVILSFEKGSITKEFPTAFMRHDVQELEHFPNNDSLHVSVELVQRLAPDSLSVMEFKNKIDVQIAEKMSKFPLLGEKIEGKWNLCLAREFDMTNDSHLFHKTFEPGRLPLFTGRMFNQFERTSEEPLYWIDEQEGRKSLLGRKDNEGQPIDYQGYRWVHRRIARNTDSRTLICFITPKLVFTEVNSTTLKVTETGISNQEMLFLCGVCNSFTLDWMIRQKVTTTLNMFYIYQLPVPRFGVGDVFFNEIVDRAAKLICTTPEFDDLAQEVGLGSHEQGVTDQVERGKLRAELDGMVAHLYGLTEAEFAHILTTFPIVHDAVKQAALEAYRTFAPKPVDQEIMALIAQGESAELEFKSSTRWDLRENKQNKELEKVIVKTVAAFLNVEKGGTLLIGVTDDGSIVSLQHDYKTLGRKGNRDGYELFLNDLLLKNNFGYDCSPFIQITFHSVESKDVCRVAVKSSPKPVYVEDEKGEHLYIRSGNSTRMLSTREAIEYCKNRWL